MSGSMYIHTGIYKIHTMSILSELLLQNEHEKHIRTMYTLHNTLVTTVSGHFGI